MAADCVANTRIGELTDSTVTTVLNWRGRYRSMALVEQPEVHTATPDGVSNELPPDRAADPF
ncbi:hypothetical protein PZ894_10475 [Nocardioides sp. YIM 152315]|nr:hypothetical protein [Nocardioides sp. YIM 152315]